MSSIVNQIKSFSIGGDNQPIDYVSGWITSNTALPAVGTYLINQTRPVTNESSGLIWLPSKGKLWYALSFIAGKSTDPNDTTATARAWLIKSARFPLGGNKVEEWVGRHAFDLTLTCGNTALGTSVLQTGGATVMKYVDSIGWSTTDYTFTPGAQIIGGPDAGGDGWPEVAFDGGNADGILLAVKRDNWDSMRVLARQF